MYLGTNINERDSDGDGLEDSTEIAASFTSPLKYDTDDNGVGDGEEDYDKDGLTNLEELIHGTIICNSDSDNDGLNDYDEIFNYQTNPLMKQYP